MVRSNLAAIALAAALCATSLSAQVFFAEDFSTGVGLVPPTGWSSLAYLETDTSGGVGPWVPAPFRFDGRPWTTPTSGISARNFLGGLFTAPIAHADPDGNGDWSSLNGQYVSILRGPAFNAVGTTLLNLDFDTSFYALQSTTPLPDQASTEVWDGTVWNMVDNYTVSQPTGVSTANATTTHKSYDITAAAGGSPAAQLRFFYRYGYDWWWAIDNIVVSQPIPNDCAVLSIDAPVGNPNACLGLAGPNTVVVTVQNQGSAVIPAASGIQMDWQLNGGPINTEFMFSNPALNPNDTYQFTFATQANLTGAGDTLTVTCTYVGDTNNFNDSVTENIVGSGGLPLVNLPYAENFNGSAAQNSTVPPMGWMQDLNDGGGTSTANQDWYMHYGGTTSSNTGPLADTSGNTGIGNYYAYVEDSGGAHPQVNLISPCFDLSLNIAPICQFQLFSFNGNPSGPNTQENFLSVDVIAYPGGATTADVLGPIGDLGYATQATAQWTPQVVNLAPFAGQVVQLVFRGRSDNGGTETFYHDIAIDDVAVFEPAPTPGQAPRAGLAAFDINNALNVNTAPVSSGLGGPYFASVTQGGAMTMSFDGNPGQPIAVVYGMLNPVSASYPGGIGQFDIGGPGVDPNGIPLNLGVFVNAIAWAQGGFIGLPIDSMFFTGAGGLMSINFTFPNFGIPMGTVLTTFQSAITTPAAPFVYLSNAIEVTIN